MNWRRGFNPFEFLRTREGANYALLGCTILALAQAVFSPNPFSVLILVALLIVVFSRQSMF